MSRFTTHQFAFTRPVPPGARVRQKLPSQHVENPRIEVRDKLLAALRAKIKPGARIAITAGSRGMGNFVELLAGIVEAVKSLGGNPFIVPAMGSHGGGTAQGQAELLDLLGVTEDSVGASVHATMDALSLGSSKTGAVAHIDKLAM